MATTINDPASWVGRTLVGVDGSRLGTIAQVFTDDQTGEQQWLAVAVGVSGSKVKYIPALGAGPRGVKDVIGPWDKPTLERAADRLPGEARAPAPRAPAPEPAAPEPAPPPPPAPRPSRAVKKRRPAPEPAARAAPEPPAPAAPRSRRRSGTNLTEIEGLGPEDAAALVAAGVSSIDALLETAGPAAGRRALARESGIEAGTVLEWVNRADLMRIRGVGSEYSDLLESAGVDTVKELARRNPANLQGRLAELNDELGLVERAPSEAEVERWVAEAKTLPAAITY